MSSGGRRLSPNRPARARGSGSCATGAKRRRTRGARLLRPSRRIRISPQKRRDAIETLAESTVDARERRPEPSFRDEIRGGTRARGVGLEGPEEGRSGRDPEGVAEPPTSLAAKLASLKDEFASLYETDVA